VFAFNKGSPEPARSKNTAVNQSIDLSMDFEDENTIKEDDLSKCTINEDGSSKCAICLTGKREILFFPCKHFGTCVECSLRLENCITCRGPIKGMLKIFLV